MKEQEEIRIARQEQIAAARAEAGGFIAEHLNEETNSFTGSAAPEGEEVSELSQVELTEEEQTDEAPADEAPADEAPADEAPADEEEKTEEVEAPKKETAAQKKKRLAAEADAS